MLDSDGTRRSGPGRWPSAAATNRCWLVSHGKAQGEGSLLVQIEVGRGEK